MTAALVFTVLAVVYLWSLGSAIRNSAVVRDGAGDKAGVGWVKHPEPTRTRFFRYLSCGCPAGCSPWTQTGERAWRESKVYNCGCVKEVRHIEWRNKDTGEKKWMPRTGYTSAHYRIQSCGDSCGD